MYDWIIILVLLILFVGLSNLLWFAALKDFKNRKFSNPSARNKWRWIISFVPFGYLAYLKRYYNMPPDFN